MMAKGDKKPKMRRNTVRPVEVARDGAGNVTMIRLYPFKDNPLAPRSLVSKIGGIYREDHHLIRCTFIDEFKNSEGDIEAVAQAHLIWKTEHDWLASREVFEFAMMQFRRGAFFDDDGGGRRAKTTQ